MTFLRMIGGLGRVRAVLHNANGLAEVFCDAACFRLNEGRLDVVLPAAHMHVDLAALSCARLLDKGGHNHPTRRSVVLYGPGGEAAVALVLDAEDDAARRRQQATFAELRAQFGEHVPLQEDRAASERVLH